LKLFCVDVEASQVAQLTNISRPTINSLFDKLRERIAHQCELESPFETGEVELDESYFGARRVRGIRGRGAKVKIPVFGMLKRRGNVYTQIIKNCSIAELKPIIEGHISKDGTTIYTDGFKSYDGLADYGYKRHYRVQHGANEFARGRTHINGIENFWGLCKVRLVRFRGIHKQKFYLHLKECEFRYNHRNENLYRLILKMLQKKIL
jgi:transposase